MPHISYKDVINLVVYQPNTGALWSIDGDTAVYNDCGYKAIKLRGCKYRVARIAWVYMGGVLLKGMDIDHINGDPSDNRYINLRQCTRSQNTMNARIHKDNTSGVKGVDYHKKRNQWRARVSKDGYTTQRWCSTREEAALVVVQMRMSLHGMFAKHN